MASFIPGIAGHGARGKKLKKLIKVSLVDDNEYDRLHLKRIGEQSIGFTVRSGKPTRPSISAIITPHYGPAMTVWSAGGSWMSPAEPSRRIVRETVTTARCSTGRPGQPDRWSEP